MKGFQETKNSICTQAIGTKRYLIVLHIILLTIFSPQILKAQLTELKLGLKAGINISNAYDAVGESFAADSKIGYVFGASLSIPLDKTFGIQPELLYSQKGFHSTGKISGKSYNFTRTTNYLDVPLQFQLKVFKFVSILAGPQYSYLISTNDEFKTGEITPDQQNKITLDNNTKNAFSLVTGIDLKIKHFLISGKLNWDLVSNSDNSSSTSPRYKNQWQQITFGYMFN